MKRRLFLSAAALTSAGLALPTSAATQAVPPKGDGKRDIPRYPQDAWLDQIPGKHRLFIDATDAEGAGNALGYAWNFMRTSTTGYQEKDEDQAIVICLRHNATEFAFSNEVWARYDVLRKQKYTSPETDKKVKGGNIFRPGSSKPKSMEGGFNWDDMAKRGVHYAICNAATRGLAREIVGEQADKEAMQKVVDELVASAPANAHFMASGIVAAQRAGEYGYTVIKG
jgi:hypothetical protein